MISCAMFRMGVAIVGLLVSVSTVAARFGVDLSVAVDTETWKCLFNEDNTTFGIVRVYRSKGEVDTNGAANLISAHDAGLRDLHGYIFPCITSSEYATDNGIQCASAAQQVEDTVSFLESNGVHVFSKNAPVEEDHVTIRRLWLDIEDENPSKYYDSDPAVNQAFIQEMVTAIEAKGMLVGIYTTKTYWQQIMDNVEGYSQYPLWYPRYDGENSMDFFDPFAGWKTVLIKQTNGDVNYCGITQVDSDFME